MTYTYCFTIHVNENLKNIFHQELTLDYHCFCGYIYNSMYMYKHEHVPAEIFITDSSGFHLTE